MDEGIFTANRDQHAAITPRCSSVTRCGAIERRLRQNRRDGATSLVAFLNAGDPDLATTVELIGHLGVCGVDVIELGVPFPDSCTDGEVIRRSHSRALDQGVRVEEVLDMIRTVRKLCAIPIFLMADFGYSVKPLGLVPYLENCKDAGADGVLLHCLPPMLTPAYREAAHRIGLETIFSLYPQTAEAKRKSVYAAANGFLYLVSQYARTGAGATIAEATLAYVKKIRSETALPLVVGFGVKSRTDVVHLAGAGADGVVVGSRLTETIEAGLHDKPAMFSAVHALFHQLGGARRSGVAYEGERT